MYHDSPKRLREVQVLPLLLCRCLTRPPAPRHAIHKVSQAVENLSAPLKRPPQYNRGVSEINYLSFFSVVIQLVITELLPQKMVLAHCTGVAHPHAGHTETFFRAWAALCIRLNSFGL